MDLEPRDPVAVGLGEPEVAVRAGRDPDGGAMGGDTGLVFGDDARRRDLPDPVVLLREPEVPVWTGGEPEGIAVLADTSAVFRHNARRRDLPDAVAVVLGEPNVAVRAGSDIGEAAAAGDAVFGDDADRRDLPDAVTALVDEP